MVTEAFGGGCEGLIFAMVTGKAREQAAGVSWDGLL